MGEVWEELKESARFERREAGGLAMDEKGKLM